MVGYRGQRPFVLVASCRIAGVERGAWGESTINPRPAEVHRHGKGSLVKVQST